MEEMHEGNIKLRKQSSDLRLKYASLLKYAEENNITLPPELAVVQLE